MGDFSKDAKDLMDDFASMGRKFSRLAHDASRGGDKSTNRQFGKAVKAYQDFFAELKKLYKLL
jgi:hypothetical protein